MVFIRSLKKASPPSLGTLTFPARGFPRGILCRWRLQQCARPAGRGMGLARICVFLHFCRSFHVWLRRKQFSVWTRRWREQSLQVGVSGIPETRVIWKRYLCFAFLLCWLVWSPLPVVISSSLLPPSSVHHFFKHFSAHLRNPWFCFREVFLGGSFWIHAFGRWPRSVSRAWV